MSVSQSRALHDSGRPVVVQPTSVGSTFVCLEGWQRYSSAEKLYPYVRCHRCDVCRSYRAYRWTLRSRAEARRAARNWLITLTFGASARARLAGAATHLGGEWSQAERLATVAAPEVQKFIKRARRAQLIFRMAWAIEHHKSGWPHAHLLLHEGKAGEKPLWIETVDVLRRSWEIGISDIRECEPKGVGYVSKYVAKGPAKRMRASRLYGLNELGEIELPPTFRLVRTPGGSSLLWTEV